MRSIFLPLILLPALVLCELSGQRTGPSAYYEELTEDTLIPFLNSSFETVLVLYSDQCSHCQEIHPQQEKAAKKVLQEYPRTTHWEQFDKVFPEAKHSGVRFARYDVYLWKGAKMLEKKLLDAKMKGFAGMEEDFGAPQAYLGRSKLGGLDRVNK